jgi:phosphoribosylanthranilate isomerase
MNLTIKVCGMREQENILQIASCDIDILGFILYEKSARFIGYDFDSQIIASCSKKTAGVFVNHPIEYVIQKQQTYLFDFLQIHGNESPEYCKKLQQQTNAYIIKAFLIDENFSDTLLQKYSPYCDYFLFDTKTEVYGGSGKKFNWNMLHSMNINKPFFLSGGITPNDIESIVDFKHSLLFGIDINSKFELQPALKNVNSVHTFAQQIKTHQKK